MGILKKEIARNVFFIALGTTASLFIITIFQLVSPYAFPPLEEHNPQAFWKLTEKYRPIQLRNEVIGVTLGVFAGAFLTALLCKTKRKAFTLLEPILVVIVITIALWPFTLQKELILLSLPILILIALSAYSLVRLIKREKMAKKISTFLIFVCLVQSISGQNSTKKEPNIKQFWLVVLKTGPNDKTITDSTERSKIFAGHFSNMERLYYDGILKAAGPFGKNDFTWRGLFILDCASKEEAETHVKTDPAVAAGVFVFDIAPWWSEPSGSFKPGKPKKKKKGS